MDTDAIGDVVNKLYANQLENDDDYEDEVDEVDDIDDCDDEEPDPVLLGFVEKPKNHWSLRRQHFPSKAGGVPAWLDPINIPSGSSFMCDICEEPLQFLLQVYAPIEKESTFHRMLFVFMCPSLTCLLRDQHEQWKRHPEKPYRSVKVFRSQLPRVNDFYSSESPKYDGSHKPACSGATLCDWCCTWKGDKCCKSCKQVWYCSEIHQAMSWRSGHKVACQKLTNSSTASFWFYEPNIIGTTSLESSKVGSNWPEFEIIIEDESEYNKDISEDNSLALSPTTKWSDEINSLSKDFQGDDDQRSWADFSEHIVKAPEQVLRYYRNSNAKPIWPMSSGRPSKDDIPKCTYCGGAMCCEFQILPQLLYYFGIKNEVGSLDWASIVIYACEASCEGSLSYKQEFVWVQLYSS